MAAYYSGNTAWEYVGRRTVVDLKAILENLAAERIKMATEIYVGDCLLKPAFPGRQNRVLARVSRLMAAPSRGVSVFQQAFGIETATRMSDCLERKNLPALFFGSLFVH